jgi:hypothetical protein
MTTLPPDRDDEHPARRAADSGDLQRRIEVAAQRCHDAKSMLDAERELRDRAIVEALDQNLLSGAEVAHAAKLSVPRVFEILAIAG